MKTPLMKRNVMLPAYFEVTTDEDRMPNRGKSTIGNKAVTTSGMISVIQSTAIQIAIAIG